MEPVLAVVSKFCSAVISWFIFTVSSFNFRQALMLYHYIHSIDCIICFSGDSWQQYHHARVVGSDLMVLISGLQYFNFDLSGLIATKQAFPSPI